MNPAVSVGMVVGGYMPLWKLFHYFVGQLVGAIIGRTRFIHVNSVIRLNFWVGSTVVYSFYMGLLNQYLNNEARGSLEVTYLKHSGVFSCKLHPTVTALRVITNVFFLLMC